MRKTRFHEFVSGLLLGWVLSILYVAGLTLLFPFLYFLALPGATSPVILAVAAVLIVLSFLGFLWQEGRLGRALKSLSKITLIPGIIGVLFSLLGREIFVNYVKAKFAAPDPVMSLFIGNIDQAVPKIQALTVVYILLGVFLWFLGDKFEGKKGII